MLKRCWTLCALIALTVTGFAADFGDIPANLTIGAGQAVRRNAGNTLFEAFTPSTSSPGGSNQQFQYNNSGAFGGISFLTFDGTIPLTLSKDGGANTRFTGMKLINPTSAVSNNENRQAPSIHMIENSKDSGGTPHVYDHMISGENGRIVFGTSTDGSGYGGTGHASVSIDSAGNLTAYDGDQAVVFAALYGLDTVNTGGDGSHPSRVGMFNDSTPSVPGLGLANNGEIWWDSGSLWSLLRGDTGLSRSGVGVMNVRNTVNAITGYQLNGVEFPISSVGIPLRTSTNTWMVAGAGTDYADLAWKTFAVSGQSNVVADTASDTVTLAAGSNMTITTNAVTDTITFAASGASAPLTLTISDAATNTVANPIILGHNSSATPLANFGTGIRLQAKDSTTADQDLAGIEGKWTTPTHSSVQSAIDFKVVSANALAAVMTLKGTGSSGIGILDFASSGGLTFGGAAGSGKIVRADGTSFKSSTSTYPDGLGSTGKVLISSSGNYVESTPSWPTAAGTSGFVVQSNGTNFVSAAAPAPAAPETLTLSDSGTNTVPAVLILDHESSGTPATGFGSRITFKAKTTTTANVDQAAIEPSWVTATGGSQKSSLGIDLVNGASLGRIATFFVGSSLGSLDVGGTGTDPGGAGGIINAQNGYWAGNAAPATGKILQSTGGLYYTNSTPTWPTAAGTSGKIVQSDGTNLVSSTPTWPTTGGTTGYTVRTDGTNYSAYPQDMLNSSTADDSSFSTSDRYVAGSSVVVAAGDFKAKGQYRCVFDMVKSAGTGAIVISVRIGTAGTTSDTAQITFTFGAGTGVADTGTFEVVVNWRSVGSGTSAVVSGLCRGTHNLATTGLFNNAASWVIVGTTSGGFNSSTATTMGLSFNGGTAFAGTNKVVQATLMQ